MEVRHADDTLARVETDLGFTGGLGQGLVKAFRKRMQQVRAAVDERTFYALNSLHFEKLHGRAGQYSMRLNDQWRLIIEFEGTAPERVVVVVGFEDYH